MSTSTCWPSFKGFGIPEGHLDAQDPRIGGPAGIVGTRLASDDGNGDLFDLALPADRRITLGRDGRFRRRGDARNIEFIDLGLDPEPGQSRRSSRGASRV